jgi:glycosyltransferase involved in cell wall biosynthesis
MTAAVSIILPTFNRADVIRRAVDSVLAQTFADWELLVIDDGSTDHTADVIDGIDSRVRLIRQKNAGVYAARNTGLTHARGRFITFLDSDDAWLPHYLAITTGFLNRSPDDQIVATEFLEDWADADRVRQDHTQIAEKFVPMARAIRSRQLQLPPGATDNYLRVYSTREPLADDLRAVAARAGYPDAALYRGHIADHLRWGYLHWLPIVLVRREAVDAVGPFDAQARTAADFRFFSMLYRRYRANMISLPSAIKYEYGAHGRHLAQGHLATGTNQFKYALAKLSYFDQAFLAAADGDPEIMRVRALHQLSAARTAIALGLRAEARSLLRDVRRHLPQLIVPHVLIGLLRLVPSDRWVRAIYRSMLTIAYYASMITATRLSPRKLLALMRKKLRKR